MKVESRLKESEEKIKSLNRVYQTESEEFKKKEQHFKRVKESMANSIWKTEREVRKALQESIKKILSIVDESNTGKIV